MYQREIRKFKEKALHQTAQLYSVQHQLATLRISQTEEDVVNHNIEPVNHVLTYNDTDKTPVNHDTPHRELIVSHSEMTPVRRNFKYDYRPSRGVVNYDSSIVKQKKRHSVSHV